MVELPTAAQTLEEQPAAMVRRYILNQARMRPVVVMLANRD